MSKIMLITGASRGIGRAIAATLLARGARVAVTGRTREAAEAAAAADTVEEVKVAKQEIDLDQIGVHRIAFCMR